VAPVKRSAQKNTNTPISTFVAILALYSMGTIQLVIIKENTTAVENSMVENMASSCLCNSSTNTELRQEV
jgi:hypothetical protein